MYSPSGEGRVRALPASRVGAGAAPAPGNFGPVGATAPGFRGAPAMGEDSNPTQVPSQTQRSFNCSKTGFTIQRVQAWTVTKVFTGTLTGTSTTAGLIVVLIIFV